MKRIIERNLPLNVQYILIDKQYIPLEEGGAGTCDNCGKIIANVATVREGKNIYNIGFDCLETVLINNSLLSTNDILEYEKAKKMIPKILRFSKTVKEQLKTYKTITGLKFEVPTYKSDYYTFYWLTNNQQISRNNDYVKLTEMDFDFLLSTLKNIFPNLLII